MAEINNQEVGVAGELRVMSELILKGYNPAKSYIDNGVDIFLQDGRTIQVKTSRKKKLIRGDNTGEAECYKFTLKRGEQKRAFSSNKVDLLICFGVETEDFWIIPAKKVDKKSQITIPFSKVTKYSKYKNEWKVIEEVN